MSQVSLREKPGPELAGTRNRPWRGWGEAPDTLGWGPSAAASRYVMAKSLHLGTSARLAATGDPAGFHWKQQLCHAPT